MIEKFPSNPADPPPSDDDEERKDAARRQNYGEAPDRSAAIGPDIDQSQGSEFLDEGTGEPDQQRK